MSMDSQERQILQLQESIVKILKIHDEGISVARVGQVIRADESYSIPEFRRRGEAAIKFWTQHKATIFALKGIIVEQKELAK